MLSQAIQEHFANPRNIGSLPNADVIGYEGIPGQGPYMALFLRMQSETIAEARFETYGCPTACGFVSFLTCWIEGKTPTQVLVMEAGDLIAVLGSSEFSDLLHGIRRNDDNELYIRDILAEHRCRC